MTKFKVFSGLASLLTIIAAMATSQASWFIMHQPRTPKSLQQ